MKDDSGRFEPLKATKVGRGAPQPQTRVHTGFSHLLNDECHN
jgi:hypothetical protein